jgi:hypothetical protein
MKGVSQKNIENIPFMGSIDLKVLFSKAWLQPHRDNHKYWRKKCQAGSLMCIASIKSIYNIELLKLLYFSPKAVRLSKN